MALLWSGRGITGESLRNLKTHTDILAFILVLCTKGGAPNCGSQKFSAFFLLPPLFSIHTAARELQTRTFEGPNPAFKTPPKFHEKTPKRGKKENCGGRVNKRAKFCAVLEGGRSWREGGPRRGSGEGRSSRRRSSREGSWRGMVQAKGSVMGGPGARTTHQQQHTRFGIQRAQETGDRKTPLHLILSRWSEKTRRCAEKPLCGNLSWG